MVPTGRKDPGSKEDRNLFYWERMTNMFSVRGMGLER